MASPLKLNVGSTDRIIRIILGIAVIALAFVFRGSLGNIGLGIGAAIGLVFIGTGIFRFCPAYVPFGLSTRCGDCCSKD
ncbi:MAG: DUF2892 domain-containing protein [Algisphaera sp.]